MGVFKGKRNKTNLTIKIKIRNSINNYSKVKKNNNNRQPKCKTSTPIHQSKSTKRKRLFELKSLLHTPIKSPLSKKMKYTPSKSRKKSVPSNNTATHTNDDTFLDKTWVYPLSEDSPDSKNYPVIGSPTNLSSHKKVIKRALLYHSDELDQNKEKDLEELSYISIDLELKSSKSNSNATTSNKRTCMNESLYNSIDVSKQNMNSTQTDHIDGYKSNTLPVDSHYGAGEINSSEIKKNIANDTENDECLQKVMCEVIKELEKSNLDREFIDFLNLVATKRFPLNNVAFLLFMDVVKFFSTEDIRTIRYSDTTLKFFWLGKKLFGGKFIRFLTGPKNEGDRLLGHVNLSPENSKINFAGPSEETLRKFNPLGYEIDTGNTPGILVHMIDKIAEQNTNDKTYVLMFDGKKIKTGADVDLLGLEEPPLKKQQEIFSSDVEIVENALQHMKLINEQVEDQNEVTEDLKSKLSSILLNIFKVISKRMMELRKLKVSKALALQRYREKIKKDPSFAKSLTYAMDSCRTASYRIENCLEVFIKAQWEICRCGAYLNNALHLFARGSVVTEECPRNAIMLKEVDETQLEYGTDEIPTALVKQRSDNWFNARKQVKVTGSSVYRAVGCDTLKAQKEHFDEAVNKIERSPFSDEQKRAMEHGTISEIHQVATLTQVILPFLLPELLYHEEGYYKEDGVIVSPDGSIRNKDGTVVYAFEGKAPVGNNFTTKQHYKVPQRYITQTLYEDKVLKAEKGTLYMCWTEESTSLFLVPQAKSILETSTQIIKELYQCETPKRPTRLTDDSRRLKVELREHIEKCEFIGEFPSVKVEQGKNKSANENRNQCNEDLPYSYDDITKALMKVNDSLAECYNLQRKMASQVLVFLLSDLDRAWKSELPHAVPIMYCFRGYSLSMDIARQLLDQCRHACAEKGIGITATSSDGEFISLIVKDKNGEPLTLNQLSKVVWSEVCKLKKPEIVGKLQQLNKNHTIETDEQGKLYVVSECDCFKSITTEVAWRHMKRAKHSKKDKPDNNNKDEISKQNENTLGVNNKQDEHDTQRGIRDNDNNQDTQFNNMDIENESDVPELDDNNVKNGQTELDVSEPKHKYDDTRTVNENGLTPVEKLKSQYKLDGVNRLNESCENVINEHTVTEAIDENIDAKAFETQNDSIDDMLLEMPFPFTDDSYDYMDYLNNTSDKPNTDNETDLDQTLSYDFETAVSDVNEEIRHLKINQEISETEASDILKIFRDRNSRKWNKTTNTRIKKIMNTSLHNLTNSELGDIAAYYNLSIQANEKGKVLKTDLINSIAEYIGTTPNIPLRIGKRRQPKSLKELASKSISRSSYPKEALNVVYSTHIWPEKVQKWKKKGKVANTIEVKGENESFYFDPYYIPEYDEDTEEFRVFTYDKTHLGTNLRKCLCLNKVHGISITAWKCVSECKPSVLHPSLVKVSDEGKILDQMKEQLARTMVSEQVENEMIELGYSKEAEFCNVIREGLYRADDTPGIPAMERCRQRIRLMQWLDKDVNFGTFPCYGGYIKGLSHILYEGLRSSLEAKLYLYMLSNSGTYNVRAPNTLCSESFFSTMQEADPWGQGILSADGVKKHMKDFTTITSLKMESSRNIFIKTKRDTVYPSPEISNLAMDNGQHVPSDTRFHNCDSRESKFIACIEPRDHFFDSDERARLHKTEKLYHPSTSNSVRGELPIRSQYGYKIREGSMLPSERLNAKLNDDVQITTDESSKN